MDKTTRVGITLLGGLAVIAVVVVVAVILLDAKVWVGLLVLAVLDAALMAWAWSQLKFA